MSGNSPLRITAMGGVVSAIHKKPINYILKT
jgi:hypothetical protein